jgi:Putative Holin-like Toxin (Hol-Tox)
LGGHGFPSKGGEAMEVKDAITIMFLFGMFILALLTYINHKNKRK